VFSRRQLLAHVGKQDQSLTERNIDVHVLSIRKKLGSRKHLIDTVWGVGYRFRDKSR
jgi:DNA-binding response OmpR family regulator